MSPRDEFVVDILELMDMRLGIRKVERRFTGDVAFSPDWRRVQTEILRGVNWRRGKARFRYPPLGADDFPER